MPFVLTHPAAAWFLPAVALPILFHLFFRLRHQVREFPSLMFFLRIDPRLSAKRKIHQWLLLLLRCLFLLALILALLRPLIGLKSPSDHVARFILIDNSGSLAGASASGTSKLSLAVRAAERLIAASRPGDTVALQLMVPDPAFTLPAGFASLPAVQREALDKLMPADGAASVPKAIRLALATLHSAKTPLCELYIITDLQEKNWTHGEIGVDSTTDRVVIHRLDTPPLSGGAVSIAPVGIPAHAIPAGRITPISFALQNHGTSSARIRLNSVDDSGKNVTREIAIAAGASTSVILTYSFATPGFHWARAWVEGDAAPTAHQAELGFWITDAQKVLFVGTPDDFAAMPFALAPGGTSDLSGLDTAFVPPEQLSANLVTKPLAIAVTWENWPQDNATAQALHDYVSQGGTLFVVPASKTDVAPPPAAASWLDATSGSLQEMSGAEPVMLLQNGDLIWHNLLDLNGQPRLGVLHVFHYRPVKTTLPHWQTLIASDHGATLLARQNIDHGRVFVSGLAFSPTWSSLPLKAGFVVLMQNAVFGDQAGNIPVQNIHAGEEIHFESPEAPIVVKSLAGSALEWRGSPGNLPSLPRAGVYAITQSDKTIWVAASGNSDEAEAHFLPPGRIALLRDVPHEVVALTKMEDINQAAISQASGTLLYRWLMLFALAILLIESWWANERSSDLSWNFISAFWPSTAPGKTTSKPANTARP